MVEGRGKILKSSILDHAIVEGKSGTINPPAPKVLGRDRPDGTRKRLQVYLGGGGGAIIRPKPPVFDRS